MSSIDILVGAAGQGVRTKLPDKFKKPAHQATLVQWFLTIPGAHPMWSHYIISLIHLREIPGVKAALKKYPDAEYEMVVTALDPTENPDVTNPDTWMHMVPLNVTVQFHGVTDEGAKCITDELAKMAVQGQLLIEPSGIRGAREAWTEAVWHLANEWKGDRKQ